MKNELLEGFYLLDAFVEPLTGQVTRNGASVHLPSKAMEVLLCLAKNPRSLVTRELLIDHVWGDGKGSAEALSHAVGDIRHAFDDHAAHPTLIQTVPKRGYRLLAEPAAVSTPGTAGESVEIDVFGPTPFWKALLRHGVVQAAAAYLVVGWLLIQIADTTFSNLGLPSWTESFVAFAVVGGFPIVVLLAWFLEFAGGRLVLDSGRHTGGVLSGLGRNYLAIIAAYAIATVGAGTYQWLVGFDVTIASPAGPVLAMPTEPEDELLPLAENSVAVLKFDNLDGSEITEVFSAGLSEDILDQLARVPGLLVPGRNDSWSLSMPTTSEEVRRRLRVKWYLEGTVRIENDHVRVVAQLIDSETGYHSMSRPFDYELDDFAELQPAIARTVVANLRPALPEESMDFVLAEREDAELDAYLEYRRGMQALYAPRTEASVSEAMDHFEAALTIDEEYAAAHAGMCNALTTLYEIVGDTALVPNAERSCASALSIGPRLPIVMHVVANLKTLTGDFDAAESTLRVALELNPRDATALAALARVYRRQQRFDEAEETLEMAIDLQPGNWRMMNGLGSLQFSRGDFAQAARQFRKVVYLDPGNYVAYANMGSAELMLGEFEDARDALLEALSFEENYSVLSNLGIVYYYLGNFEDSAEIHRKAVAGVPNSSVAWLSYADALHFADRQDDAHSAFAKARDLARAQLGVNPADTVALSVLAWSEAMLGDTDGAAELIERLLEIAPEDPYSHYYQALVFLRQGRDDAAVDSIAAAIERGYSTLMISAEPYLAELRSTSDFRRLVVSASDDR